MHNVENVEAINHILLQSENLHIFHDCHKSIFPLFYRPGILAQVISHIYMAYRVNVGCLHDMHDHRNDPTAPTFMWYTLMASTALHRRAAVKSLSVV